MHFGFNQRLRLASGRVYHPDDNFSLLKQSAIQLNQQLKNEILDRKMSVRINRSRSVDNSLKMSVSMETFQKDLLEKINY